MATFIDLQSGVELNIISIRRSSLNGPEQDVARRLRAEGEDVHVIAAMLGTNPARVIDAIGPTGRASKAA